MALTMGTKKLRTKAGVKEYSVPLATYGNFSFVSAPPKTQKTFFISLITSIYLNEGNKFGGKMKAFRDGRCVIHFDTEQGKFHAQKVFERIANMSNLKKNNKDYFTFALRTINHKMRTEFIDHFLSKTKNPGLIIIDGIADLCPDTNNIQESNTVVQKVMEWSANYKCHIITVIHSNLSNHGIERPTGHLGSFLEKKAETHIQLEPDEQKKLIKVKCKRSRNFPFKDFFFSINDFGFPQIVDESFDPLKDLTL